MLGLIDLLKNKTRPEAAANEAAKWVVTEREMKAKLAKDTRMAGSLPARYDFASRRDHTKPTNGIFLAVYNERDSDESRTTSSYIYLSPSFVHLIVSFVS